MTGQRAHRPHPAFAPADPHASGRKSPVYGRTLSAIAALKPGQELVYHTDGASRISGAFAAVADATEQGTVTPLQRREDGVLRWIARRR